MTDPELIIHILLKIRDTRIGMRYRSDLASGRMDTYLAAVELDEALIRRDHRAA